MSTDRDALFKSVVAGDIKTVRMNDRQSFSAKLREEIEKTQDRKQKYVLAKLTFVTGLLGVGYSTNILNNSASYYLLYLIPFIAFVFDLYIIGEDFSIKRAGIFIKNSKESSEEEINWETKIETARDMFSYIAVPFSTLMAVILASFGLCGKGWFMLWMVISVILMLILIVHRQIQNIILDKFESNLKI